jgi:hypothetical protein
LYPTDAQTRRPQADAAGPTEPTPEQVGAARLAAVGHHGDANAAAGAGADAAAAAADAAAHDDADGGGGGGGDYATGEEGGEEAEGAASAEAEAEAAETAAGAAADAEAGAGAPAATAAAAHAPGVVARVAAAVRSWLAGKPGTAADAAALRAAHTRATTKLAELRARHAKLTAQLAVDGGADGAYLALAGQCFTLSADPYTYHLCPFDAARQEPGATSLGTWQGWAAEAGPGSAAPAFSFTGGLACWNGPQRSLRVDVACGASNVLIKVEEPNRCEYRALFRSPAACDPAAAAALADKAKAANAAADEATVPPVHSEL